MSKLQMQMESKIGSLYLVCSEQGLHGVFWKKQTVPMLNEKASVEATWFTKTLTQLEEYLDGKRKVFELPLCAEGTDFQKKVWHELMKIPYGQTRSYKEIAVALSDANASRAVGNANGKNPISIIVPCHRVISSDGSMGGYAGGLDTKQKLLSLEELSWQAKFSSISDSLG
ncbi:MAG: methylated-DNA--[protein]-cysteine S-methyltransferase [Gammaproteobacteria bacterium]|nr:methylated-DNA--[protein]-cysteine S-methyltransferase [Gammaproteobacteria bacterium]